MRRNPIIDAYGTKRWFQGGRLHRTDGPAVLYQDGSEYWYQDDLLHRTNGPAVIDVDVGTVWYIDDQRVRTRSHYQQLANISDEDMTYLILKYGEIK